MCMFMCQVLIAELADMRNQEEGGRGAGSLRKSSDDREDLSTLQHLTKSLSEELRRSNLRYVPSLGMSGKNHCLC